MNSTRRTGKIRTLIALAACAAFVIAAAPGNGNAKGPNSDTTVESTNTGVQGLSWR
jgi:hypothetical protein